MHTIDRRSARRLALARAGLLKTEWTGLPARASGRGKRALGACHRVIRGFGYLQLDSVSIAGARTHGIVLQSRIEGLDASIAEELLQPGAPVFEYWGHEASWMPIELYPVFGFRRRAFAHHPWWGDLVGENPAIANEIRRRIREEGPLRSADFHGANKGGWWNIKIAAKVASAMWGSGELAVRERRHFHRVYDLPERVIPAQMIASVVGDDESLEHLVLLALQGHGWASTGTISRTWRFRGMGQDLKSTLVRLVAQGRVLPCSLVVRGARPVAGWVRPEDLGLAERLRAIRPRRDRGVLLSPFDPVLWDRPRVQSLFGFEQVIEIYKPAGIRKYGYYCLPVLAGEHLIGRVDLKAHRRAGILDILSCRFEDTGSHRSSPENEQAMLTALSRFGGAVGLEPRGWP